LEICGFFHFFPLTALTSHTGDVFQRLLNILIQPNELMDNLTVTIQHRDQIGMGKLATRNGGWSEFPQGEVSANSVKTHGGDPSEFIRC